MNAIYHDSTFKMTKEYVNVIKLFLDHLTKHLNNVIVFQMTQFLILRIKIRYVSNAVEIVKDVNSLQIIVFHV